MVVFTCQHCGDPVKKPAVQKHYSTKCRYKSPHLTCVDCIKDFSAEDYNSHNQCMTEAQRYSAQGTVFKEQKGKKKQELYVEMIQKILSSDDMDLNPKQRELLQVCAKYDNVPRKFKPFQNFMKNVARSRCPEDVNIVFNVIENAWKKISTESSSSVEKNTTDVQKAIENGIKTKKIAEEGVGDDKMKSDSGKKIKKKKRSSSSLDVNGEENCGASEETCEASGERELCEDDNNIKPKKGSKKINNDNNLNEEIEDTETVIDNTLNKESKKKKKHKRKSQCLDTENGLDMEKENDVEGDGGEGKCVNNSEETISDDIKENLNNKSKKLLKKQKKYEKYLAEIENEAKLKVNDNVDQDIDDDSINLKKKKKSKKLKSNENKMESVGLSEDKNTVNTIDCSSKSDDKKVKKRKLVEEIMVEIPEKKIKEDSQGSELSTVAVFDWADVIMRVLQSRPDKELSLKKLSKKVVNEYQTVKQDHRTYEELLAKFNKKVNKIKGVRVLKDRAKLIE